MSCYWLAAAMLSASHERIAAVPAAPPQEAPLASTPSVRLSGYWPQSIARNSVFPNLNEYVRSLPGKLANAQYTFVGVKSEAPGYSWFPTDSWTKDPWPKACHFSYTLFTTASSFE